jgi:carbohydrate-selective porin OprB
MTAVKEHLPTNTTMTFRLLRLPRVATRRSTTVLLTLLSSTEVIETFYNVQINPWLQFRPDVQYIINPAGNGTVGNDWILGAELAAKF